jgi:hypothetical protein
MADWEFSCPIPRLAELPSSMLEASRKWERTALKWRALAERRRADLYELYCSKSWKQYYTDEEFLNAMGDAVAMAERWAQIVPLPEERAAAIEPDQPVAA